MGTSESLERTPLHGLHCELGAKMVPFAGYDMPVQYPGGIIQEHRHARAQAALFDVSHMGQVVVRGDTAAAGLERLVPGDILGLASGRMRYTQFTNDAGGILDDLMVTNAGDHLFVVVNASRKAHDIAHLQAALDGAVEPQPDRALLALQGPAAEDVLARLAPDCRALTFLSAAALDVDGHACFVSRSGYTGEDGFEISVAAGAAEALARRLLAEAEVAPAGLGARDSLRLEAGLCLYGHDIDETTTPVEAGLAWSIGKRRREAGGFPGAEVVRRQLAEGPPRKRVGLRPEGRAPAREGAEVTDRAGNVVGRVTSGGFAPSLGHPVAMAYVAAASAAAGTALDIVVRDEPRPAEVVRLPFVEPNYRRG